MPQRKTISSLLTVAVVVLTITGGVVGGAAAAQPKPPQNVFGQVTDQSGTAVDNATVEFVYDGSVVNTTTTDSNGNYDVNIPDPDADASEEDITVRVQGAEVSETITWSSGGSTQVDLQLGTTLPHEITGTVTDKGDLPMSGETVEVVYDGTVVNETTTASDGSYSMLVENPDTEITGESIEVRVANYDASESLVWESNNVSEVNFSVGPDVIESGSADLEGGEATVSLGTSEVESVALDLGSGTSGTVFVSQTASPTDGAAEPANNTSVAYLDIDAPSGSSGTVSVTVPKTALDSAGLAAEDVNLLHYTDGEWVALETANVESGDNVVFTADVDGFSPFAVAGSTSDDGGDTTTTATPTSTTDDGSDGGDGSDGTTSTTATPTATTTTSSGGGGGPSGGGPSGGGSDTTTTTATPTTDDGSTTTADDGTTSTADDGTTATSDDSTTTEQQTTVEPTDTTEEPVDTSEEPDDESGNGIPGFGVGIALVAIIGAALLALRDG